MKKILKPVQANLCGYAVKEGFMPYSIALSGWQLVGILFLIFLVFVFCVFFDFLHKCRNCGSRWREIIDRTELCQEAISGNYVLFRMKIRRCLHCGDRMLLKKKYPKKYTKQKGKNLVIKL